MNRLVLRCRSFQIVVENIEKVQKLGIFPFRRYTNNRSTRHGHVAMSR